MALSFEILLRRLKRRYVPPYLRLSLLRVSKIFKDELLKSMSAVFALRSAQILETTSWSTYNWPPLLKTSNPQSNNTCLSVPLALCSNASREDSIAI